MQKRFADRVVIITGASSGLGLATARAFASEGAKVVLAARNAERLHQAATELKKLGNNQILNIICDVSKREDVDQLIAKTIAEFGCIDILVNNAGMGMVAPFESVQLADAVALFETNFFGALNCVQAALPQMKRQHSGHIVNISSVGGLRGIPNISIYSASKAGLIALTDALRIELKQYGIALTVVCPGRMRNTRFFEQAKRYGPRKSHEVLETLTADTVAQAVLNAVVKRKRMVILPFYMRLLYALDKFFPRLIDYFLFKRMPKLA